MKSASQLQADVDRLVSDRAQGNWPHRSEALLAHTRLELATAQGSLVGKAISKVTLWLLDSQVV